MGFIKVWRQGNILKILSSCWHSRRLKGVTFPIITLLRSTLYRWSMQIRIRRENCLIFNLTSSKRWRKSSIHYENPLCGGRFKSLKSWIWNICCVCGWDYYTLYSKFLNLEPHEIVTLNFNNKKNRFLFVRLSNLNFFM